MCLVSRGQAQEAVQELKRAQEVEPDSMIIDAVGAWVDFLAGQYNEGIRQSRKTLELDPQFAHADIYLGLSYEQKGMGTQAIKAIPTSPSRLIDNDTFPRRHGGSFSYYMRPASAESSSRSK